MEVKNRIFILPFSQRVLFFSLFATLAALIVFYTAVSYYTAGWVMSAVLLLLAVPVFAFNRQAFLIVRNDAIIPNDFFGNKDKELPWRQLKDAAKVHIGTKRGRDFLVLNFSDKPIEELNFNDYPSFPEANDIFMLRCGKMNYGRNKKLLSLIESVIPQDKSYIISDLIDSQRGK